MMIPLRHVALGSLALMTALAVGLGQALVLAINGPVFLG